MTMVAERPGNISPKQWDKIVAKHGKAKPHFQTGSPKSGSPHQKGHKNTAPKFECANDTSHQIQNIPTHQSAQEKAAQQQQKVAERQELAEKAGFNSPTKNSNMNSEVGFKNVKATPAGAGAQGNLGKLKNPSVCKAAQVPTGRHH